MAKEIADVVKGLGGSQEPPVFEESTGGEGAAGAPPASAEGSKEIAPMDVFGEEFKDKGWDDVKTDYSERVKRERELSEQLAEASNREPEFADPEVAEYNAWIKNGGNKDYNLFQRIKTVGQETTDIDALVLQKIVENPMYIGHEAKIKSEILKSTPIDKEQDSDLSDEDIAFNRAKIAEQATKAREYLKLQQDKLKLPSAVAKTNKAEVVAQRTQDWTAKVDPMLSEIKTIPLQRMVKDGEKEKLEKVADYQLPDHVLQSYKKQVLDYFPNHIDATPEAITAAKSNALRVAVFENLPYIISAAIDAEKLKWEEEAQKIYGGGVNLKSPGGVANGGVPTDVVTGAKQHFK